MNLVTTSLTLTSVLLSGCAFAAEAVSVKEDKPGLLQKAKVTADAATATARVTNEDCSPYTIHYGYDTVAAARGTSSAVVKQDGKSWYFLTADYAFGYQLENDTTKIVKDNGGEVLGAVKHPLNSADFSSFNSFGFCT